MNKFKSSIPNTLTTLNLICGLLGIYFSFKEQISSALLMIVVASFFDFFDGFLARLLKVSSPFGKELDSLSDLVSFGILPGAMLFSVQSALIGQNLSAMQIHELLCVLSPICIPVFSALRLAKFNIDERQTYHFIGLPTPANALFFGALSFSIIYAEGFLSTIDHISFILAFLTVLFSFLLVSELPLLSLKFKTLKFKDNIYKLILISGSLILLIVFGIEGIVFSILLYFVLSLIDLFSVLKGRTIG
jgi:CDP-diacylglycerol---serine O-phosphatidyltransferase